MEFDQKYLEEIKKKLPELPRKKWQRYVLLGLSPNDAYLLASKRSLAEKFEKLLNLGKAQAIAKVVINKRNSSFDQLKQEIVMLQRPIITDEKKLSESLDHVLKQNEKAVEDYKKGKKNALMFLVGQVMRAMKGRADAQIIRQKLLEKLKKIV